MINESRRTPSGAGQTPFTTPPNWTRRSCPINGGPASGYEAREAADQDIRCLPLTTVDDDCWPSDGTTTERISDLGSARWRRRTSTRLLVAGVLLATLMGILAVLTACGPADLPPVPTSPTVNLTPDDPGAIGGGR